MKKVVVTGGAGFIGSHLAEEMVQRDYHVVIIDNLSTGKVANIDSILKSGKAELLQSSITDLPLLRSVFRGAEYVFHQAAIPSVLRSVEHPLDSHEANVTGTLNVLLAARDAGVKKVVCASSSAVYGDAPGLPKTEDMTPCPQSPYAVTKLAGEYYCKVFSEGYGMPTACLRYFNVYGPRQDPNSQYAAVIPKFMSQISEGKPPVIFGDGEQSRDFVFVGDVVAANILAAESEAVGSFNIGSGERITINKLVSLLIKILGQDIEPAYRPPRPGDIKHSVADISKSKSFGYLPHHSLEEGLRQTVKARLAA